MSETDCPTMHGAITTGETSTTEWSPADWGRCGRLMIRKA